MNLKNILLLVLLMFTMPLFGQEGFIKSRVLDSDSKEPVVFASIRIKNRALGIISNLDGSFKLPTRYRSIGDTIEISSMGYETKNVLLSSLTEQLNVIELAPRIIALEETVVEAKMRRKNYSAKTIVEMAIDALRDNYPTESFSTVGYYRDYQFKDGTYINLNEAIVEIFDQGFDQTDFSTSEIRIYDYRQNRDFRRDTTASKKYDYKTSVKVIDKAYLQNFEGNELTVLRIHDALRNFNEFSFDFVGTFEKDFLPNHTFSKEKDVFLEDDVLYSIGLIARKEGYLAKGQLYISKTDFAIHKMEYTLYDSDKRKARLKKNKHRVKLKPIFDLTIDYIRMNDKMYPNYISFSNHFQLNLPPKFILKKIDIDAPEGHFTLRFNKPVDTATALKKGNYKAFYEGQSIDIKDVRVVGESVRLYPAMKAASLEIMMRKIDSASKTGVLSKDIFNMAVSDIKDIDANLVNEIHVEEYEQFREFFAQRVKPGSRAPLDNLFMNKRRPIFKNQPIVKSKNLREYWMNTPLKKSVE